IDVFLPIHEHVDEAVTDLSWRAQRSRMVAIRKDAAAPAKRPVDRASQPNRRPHEAAREGGLVARLDQKMHVIGLYGEVDDSKPRASRLAERSVDREEDDLPAQARKWPCRTQRDVHRMILLVLGPRAMRHAASWVPLSSRARTSTAP